MKREEGLLVYPALLKVDKDEVKNLFGKGQKLYDGEDLLGEVIDVLVDEKNLWIKIWLQRKYRIDERQVRFQSKQGDSNGVVLLLPRRASLSFVEKGKDLYDLAIDLFEKSKR